MCVDRYVSTLSFDAFSTVHTNKFENNRIVRFEVSWTLCACLIKHSCLRYFRWTFFVLRSFPPSTLIWYACVFCFEPLSRTFSNLCGFYENAQCISVDERPKRIEMYAFSNEIALVWRGPKYLIAFCRSRCRHRWRCLNFLFNNYSSRPNGLWVNSPWGRRPNGLVEKLKFSFAAYGKRQAWVENFTQ